MERSLVRACQVVTKELGTVAAASGLTFCGTYIIREDSQEDARQMR